MGYIKETAPDVVVILDAKRGDIGNTAKAYAKALLGRMEAQCITLNPYLGWDSLEPFLENEEQGAFVLCRTPNRSGKEVQDLMISTDGKPMKMFEYMAHLAKTWNKLNKDKTRLDFGLQMDQPHKRFKTMGGYWEIEVLEPGLLLAEYKVDVALDIPMIGGLITKVVNAMAGDDLPDMLISVRKRIDSGGTWVRSKK